MSKRIGSRGIKHTMPKILQPDAAPQVPEAARPGGEPAPSTPDGVAPMSSEAAPEAVLPPPEPVEIDESPQVVMPPVQDEGVVMPPLPVEGYKSKPRRYAEVWEGGAWHRREFDDLKKGDIFCLMSPDGVPLQSMRATRDAHRGEVQCDLVVEGRDHQLGGKA